MIALASVFFGNLDTTTQVLTSFQYCTALHEYNLDIHLGLLAEHTSLAFEQSGQICQVLALQVLHCTIEKPKE